MTTRLRLPKETTPAAQQRNLKRIEDALNSLRTNTGGLSLFDLRDVEITEATDGYVFTLIGGKFSAQALPASPVVSGTGAPVDQPATTLIFLSTDLNRLYYRTNSTVGTGATWDYIARTSSYTQP